jgi:hypothetical protein
MANIIEFETALDTKGALKDMKELSTVLKRTPLSLMIDIDFENTRIDAQKKLKALTASLQSSLGKESFELIDKESLTIVKTLIQEGIKLADSYQESIEKAKQLIEINKEIKTARYDLLSTSKKDDSRQSKTPSGDVAVNTNNNVLNNLKTDLESISGKVIDNFKASISDIVNSNLTSGISKEKYALSSCKGTDAQTQKCWENNKNYYLATA